MLYIGVVGQIACGKGVLVDALKEHGFVSFSLSSILHDDLKEKGINEFTRKTLQDMGDELRRKYGRDVLTRRAIKIIQKSKGKSQKHNSKVKIKGCIIEGIRNTAEVEYLKSLSNFTLIGVKAKRELRFKRLLERRKHWDPKTWGEFLVVDRRDLGVGTNKDGQQVGKCLAYCDYVLTNNKDKADFQKKVNLLLKKIIKINGD